MQGTRFTEPPSGDPTQKLLLGGILRHLHAVAHVVDRLPLHQPRLPVSAPPTSRPQPARIDKMHSTVLTPSNSRSITIYSQASPKPQLDVYRHMSF